MKISSVSGLQLDHGNTNGNIAALGQSWIEHGALHEIACHSQNSYISYNQS